VNDNPFEQLAQQQMVRAFKRKRAKLFASDRDAPLVPGEQDKKQRDQQRMYRNYRRHKRAEIRTLLEGQYRIPFLQLSRVLRKLTIEDSAALVAHVEQAQWMVDADRLTRYIVLGAISDRIVKLRIQNGYAPFDDSLPGELPTAFELIRNRLSHP